MRFIEKTRQSVTHDGHGTELGELGIVVHAIDMDNFHRIAVHGDFDVLAGALEVITEPFKVLGLVVLSA